MEGEVRRYVAFLRLVAERFRKVVGAAPIEGYSVTIVEASTTEIEGVAIVFRRLGVLFLTAGLALSLCGCTGPRPLRGGHALTSGPVGQSVVQGDNPAQATRQSQEAIRVRTYTVPAGSRVEGAMGGMGPMGRMRRDGTNICGGATAVIVSAPTAVVEREETRANTELGASQKDTARELGAKLASLRGIVWVGVGLFIFGIGSFAWPPLRAIIGSVTTGVAITLGGVALMILPSLIVGNELFILGGVALAVGGWFLAHRHGHLRGMVGAAETVSSIGESSPRKWASGGPRQKRASAGATRV